MDKKYFLFVGLFLVLLSLFLNVTGVDRFYYFLVAGILLKVVYLIMGLHDRTLAGGRYLLLLLIGVTMVVSGWILKKFNLFPPYVYWIMGVGFALKAYSIVMMAVAGKLEARSTKLRGGRWKGQ